MAGEKREIICVKRVQAMQKRITSEENGRCKNASNAALHYLRFYQLIIDGISAVSAQWWTDQS